MRHFDAVKQEGTAARDPAYADYRRAFEAANGPIVQEWWSTSTASGAALTVPRTSAVKSVFAAQSGAALHRLTDEETRRFPNVAAALHEADSLAIRSGEILRGTAQRVALTHVFGAVVSLLGVTEQAKQLGPEDTGAESHQEHTQLVAERIEQAIESFRADLQKAEAYYRKAAARTTQIFYFWGMAVGVLVIAVLTTLIAVLVERLLDATGLSPEGEAFALMITAVSAGGLGATVSAMWRISSGSFRADFEAGSTHARIIGSFRPFIGAIFGLGLYVALQAGFLPTLQDQASDVYLAALIAFLGGFSERLAPDVFAKADNRLVTSVTAGTPAEGTRGPD